MSKKADEKNGDLALQTIEDSVRGQLSDKAKHGDSVLIVFGCIEIDDPCHIFSEHGVLQKERCRGNRDSHSGIQKKID